MKTSTKKLLPSLALGCLLCAAGASFAQEYAGDVVYQVGVFNSAADVAKWGYGGFGATPTLTYANIAPAVSLGKGSMMISAQYSTAQAQSAYQINLGGSTNLSSYTQIEMDVRVDPTCQLDEYGNAAWFQGFVEYSSSYTFNAFAGANNIAPVATNGGWQHVVFTPPTSPGVGVEWSNIMNFGFNPYDGNYTNANNYNVVLEIANIVFTQKSATYPNLAPATYQFNDSSSVVAVAFADNDITGLTENPWYGNTNYVTWSTNDSKGNPNSGSLYVSAAFTGPQNNLVMVMPMDTNQAQWSSDTNYIDASEYTGVEMDVLWDTNNSTVQLSAFNAAGDIGGFPVGSCDNSGFTVNEICGSVTTFIPNAASNSWQHIVCPFVKIVPTDKQMTGLWLKKWCGDSTVNGTVAFWVDNITFDGAVIPTHPNQATVSLDKPVPGLQCCFTGTAGNAAYDRELICTAGSTYSFVDASGPVTYSITLSYVPPTTASGSAQIVFDQSGTATEPDWNDTSVFRIDINPATNTVMVTNSGIVTTNMQLGSAVTLLCKTNSAGGNGDLYDASDPTWNGTDATHTNSSPAVGTWSFTISNNTNILCAAPSGATTNLPFPLGFQSADVEANFPASGGMFVYFGAMGGGAISEGSRWVLQKCSISGGGVTPLSENWVAEANTGSYATGGEAGPANINANEGGNPLSGQNGAWTGTVSGVPWTDTSDSKTATGIYLLGTNTPFVLDWTANAGSGLTVLTNTTVGPGGWGTNTVLTADAWLDATYYTAEVDITNLPANGDMFFELQNP